MKRSHGSTVPSIHRKRPEALPTIAEIQSRHRIAAAQCRENRESAR